MNNLLEITDLSKSYSKSLKKSIKYASYDLLRTTVGLSTQRHSLRDTEFWALKNINLNLRRGEVLGVVGHNGAGKSTLLKCIANKLQPTLGKVVLNGSLGHMIEMSAGFDQTLTGKENVLLRGNMLGLKGKSLQSYVDKVKDFAEIDDFFDAPVQFYSSGMKSRLGFAASSSIEPDILIIDEVLAVGDLGFRLKCYERMNELARNCAVIFVSHSIGQLSRMCTRAVYLEKGKMLHDGDVKTALSLYQDKLDVIAKNKKTVTLHPELTPIMLEVNGYQYNIDLPLNYEDEMCIITDVSRFECDLRVRALLRDSTGTVLQDWNSVREDLIFPGTTKTLKINVGKVELTPGTYNISVEVMSKDGLHHLCLSEPVTFRVAGEYYNAIAIQRRAHWTFI